jgi:hypothetical protein
MNNIKESKTALIRYYTIYDRKLFWIVECDVCNKRWRLDLPKTREIHGGNILHLLNHAYGHIDREDSKILGGEE